MSAPAPDVVLVTNAYFPTIGGITTYVSGLQKELRARGYEVHVFPYPQRMMAREEAIANRVARRFVHEMVVAAFTLRTLAKILALRLKGRRVIVHTHSASFCLGVGAASRVLGARAIHTFHSPIEHNTLKLKLFLQFAELVVCVSEEQKEEYVAKCGIPSGSPVIPGGVDSDLFHPLEVEEKLQTRREVAEAHGIPFTTAPIVLFVGRIVEEKGAGTLLEAATKLRAQGEEAFFLLVGPLNQTIAQTGHVVNLLRQANLYDNIRVSGGIPNEGLARIFGMSDIFAFPTLLPESSPMVVVEAMASGIPVVASRIGATKSRVIENVTGFLVAPGDAGGLAAAIGSLLHEARKMGEMGRISRKLVLEKYSLRVMVSAYEKLYSDKASPGDSS